MDTKTGQRGVVLVVEDDSAICGVIADIVAELGLETICAHSDKEAYAHLSSLTTIRALLADVNLGRGTTGFDVARHARSLMPRLPVLYISGEASEDSFLTFGVPGSGFIQKPFTPDELLESMRARLDR